MATSSGGTPARTPVGAREEQPAREVTGHARTGAMHSIRVRLLVPIALAAVGLVGLGAVQANAAIDSAVDAQRAQTMAGTAIATVRLGHEIAQEAAEADALRARGGTSGASLLAAAQSQTDLAVTRFQRASASAVKAAPALSGVLGAAQAQVGTLALIRGDVRVLHPDEPAGSRYDDLEESLIAVADALPAQLRDPTLAATARALAALSGVAHLSAEQRDLLRLVFRRGAFGPGELAELAGLVGEQQQRLDEFNRAATPAEQGIYTQIVTGDDVLTADRLRGAVLEAKPDPGATTVDSDIWYIAQSNAMRRLDQVQFELSYTLDHTSRVEQAAAQNRALLVGTVTLLIILLSFGMAVLLASRTSRRLQRLRAGALSVAHRELPGAISELSAASGPDAVREVLDQTVARANALSIPGNDEVGEVGAALGTVHRQALRLAADEALLRLDVSALFVALSRRGQTLIHRQLRMLDEFARVEGDPQRLHRVQQMDHLAARMRRNEENLLVLAGGEPGRRVLSAIHLEDVVAAAAAEIEDSHRIEPSAIAEVGITATAVRDLVHLLAELFENATGYSPPTSRVRVSARRAVDGVSLTIFDEGIGMPAAQVTELNQRLARPTMLTAELAGTMGLLVVGRLAARHGIAVELRSSLGGGTAVLVTLPTEILTPAGERLENVRRPVLISAPTTPPGPATPVVTPSGVLPPLNRPATLASYAASPALPPVGTPPVTPVLSGYPAGLPGGTTPPGGQVPPGAGTRPPTNAPPPWPIPPATVPGQRGIWDDARQPLPPEATSPTPGGEVSTGGGIPLPRRRPGIPVMPGNVPARDAAGEPRDAPPDPDIIRARLSGLASGLAAAARRNQAGN